MTSLYIPHLILTGLIGIHCKITTVSKVSVKAGGSISIPCLYEPHYKTNVKYLCKGRTWIRCKTVVKTNQPDPSDKFSISDDTNQQIFTVTINDLTDETDRHFWCAVDIEDQLDVKQHFQLLVTDMPSLYVDQQEITASEGGSVTVLCRYKYEKETKWCRLGSTCVSDQTGSIGGTTVSINTSVPNVFTVTMSELRTESSGWYLCFNGDLQMPVHLTVHELTSTTTSSTTMSFNTENFTRTLPATTQHSPLLTSPPTNSTTSEAGGDSVQDEPKSTTKMMMILIPTLVLLLLIPAVFSGWWMIRRHKTKPEGPDITVVLQTGSDPDVHYATIVHDQHAEAQKKQNHIPEDSVTYSTIVMKDSMRQMTEPADASVIYSTLHTKVE